MAAGNWMPTLVEMAGGDNLFGRAGEHSPWMKFEELAAADPEVILISPCGFNIARRQDLPALTNRAEWSELSAVRERRVFMADGNQYFNRPGPRIVESLEILAEIAASRAVPFRPRRCGLAPTCSGEIYFFARYRIPTRAGVSLIPNSSTSGLMSHALSAVTNVTASRDSIGFGNFSASRRRRA